ncbi:conserved hypothetical protein [Theileria orientalis strain Shintoku]|uniref:Uncharacterized protein n=1 Tax=Theileria orientalis strain Shintoku TaxID=869250 RepID=J4DNJ8_THEOR|nr:conserved hypothetical protein [Theileria orientalis strain Shintoku]BAM39084.1 conserved hypothetical protein [Theileria orientalis strain Shintoku]|eukprot:XP_009689385.1 conserved hypothetical protein [Theileria orientalis strain Shintoku]
MVSSRKVQSFTNKAKKSKLNVSKTFGVDLGEFGQKIYEWLWPEGNPCQKKEKEALESMTMYNRFLESRLISNREKKELDDYNKYVHNYILHNYADEKFVNIYKRLAFHMRITPRMLYREVGAITGKFGINILDPKVKVENINNEKNENNDALEDEKNKETREDILCLRRIKFEAYTLIGAKLLRYTMMFLLRYIRLGIPPEVRLRVLSDVVKREYMSKASTMACNQVDHRNNKENASNQTYPIRTTFETQGYPYSEEPFYREEDEDTEGRWSPKDLVDEQVYRSLSGKNRAKLVCVAAALHPEYALQIVKNIAHAAGYRSERELLQNFTLKSNFTSRGARAFIKKLKEESEAHEKLREAARLYRRWRKGPETLKETTQILANVPQIAGLMRRHLESGHRIMPLKRAKMILRLVRAEAELEPEDTTLWDLLKKLIARRVMNAPPRVYKQVAKQVLALANYINPALRSELESRGIATEGLYEHTAYANAEGGIENAENLSREERIDLAKRIRANVKTIWLKKGRNAFEDTGLHVIDALSATAGYGNITNVLAIASMLSKRPENRLEEHSRQPGPDFEHSPRLEFKDFRHAKVQ